MASVNRGKAGMKPRSKSVVTLLVALGLALGSCPGAWAEKAHGEAKKDHAEAANEHGEANNEHGEANNEHAVAIGPIDAAAATITKGNSKKAVCRMNCSAGTCSGINAFRRELPGVDAHKKQLAEGVGTACAAICDHRQVYNCLASFKKVFHVDPADPVALQAAMQPVVHENHQVKHLMCSAGVLGVTSKYEDMIETLCK
jgi:hypothetical protein